MITFVDPPLWELSQKALPELVAAPADGMPESCWRCRTWTPSEDGECWNCRTNHEMLGVPAIPLDVIAMYTKPSQLRDWLTCYKGRIDDSEPFIADYVPIVTALIARFFLDHGHRITDRSGPIDVITVVPSATRPGPHPLETLLHDLPLTIPVRTLLTRGPGILDHNHPSRDGYIAVDGPAQRVLLVDDVYTTGARLNSAAYALTAAGHQLTGACVVARRFNIGYGNTPAFWEALKSEPFTWEHSPIINRTDSSPAQ